jgi:hypothetical protein
MIRAALCAYRRPSTLGTEIFMNERDKQGTPDAARPEGAPPDADAKVQGEGDYAADRRYRERTDRFLGSANIEEVARAAAPHSEEEAREMREAEKEGRSHAHLPPKPAAGPRGPQSPKGKSGG